MKNILIKEIKKEVSNIEDALIQIECLIKSLLGDKAK